jgi:tetratricopeptide (TPR) repeat protein
MLSALGRKRLFGILLAVVSTAACQTGVASGIESANDLMYRKQYVEAERLYRKLLKRLDEAGDLDDDEHAQRILVLEHLGQVNSLYLHNYKQAVADLQLIVQLYPKTEHAFAALATTADIYHHKLGDIEAAIQAYQRLVGEFPNQPETRHEQLNIIAAYFQQKNYDQARVEAEALIARWPDSADAAQARFQLANAYYLQGRYQEAINAYQQISQNKTDASLSALVLFELGNCYQELGEPERALSYYYAALSDHPNPTLVQRKIRRVRMRLHQTKPAAEIMGAQRSSAH